MVKNIEELGEARKQWFAQMEQKLQEIHTKEDDSLFYYHSSEDRIVLSHAMFWTMTSSRPPLSPLPKGVPPLLVSLSSDEGIIDYGQRPASVKVLV